MTEDEKTNIMKGSDGRNTMLCICIVWGYHLLFHTNLIERILKWFA